MIKFFLSNRILEVTEVLGAVSTTQQPSSASQRRRASASQSSHAAAYKIAPAAPGCLGSGCRHRGKREMGLSAFRGEMGLCAFLASRLCWRIRNRHLARLTRLKPSNALPLPMSPCPSHPTYPTLPPSREPASPRPARPSPAPPSSRSLPESTLLCPCPLRPARQTPHRIACPSWQPAPPQIRFVGLA